MAHQPGDAGDDGDVGVLLQPQPLLEGGLAGGLPAVVVGGEGLDDALAGGGVVRVHINAVEDAPHLPAVGGDDPLQPVGVERELQFVGVVGGDGGHIVAGKDGPLHQAHVVVELEHVFIEVALIQAEQVLQHLPAVAALVLDVVDGEYAPGPGQGGLAVAVLQQVDGHQGSLPVIAVDHIRGPADLIRGLNDRPGEKGEALAVVIMAVDPLAFEVALVVHKVVGDAVLLQLEQPAVDAPPGQAHIVILQKGHLTAPVLPNALIEREDHPHVMAQLRQFGGERARHIGQAAGFDEWGDLGGGKQNFHRRPSFPVDSPRPGTCVGRFRAGEL